MAMGKRGRHERKDAGVHGKNKERMGGGGMKGGGVKLGKRGASGGGEGALTGGLGERVLTWKRKLRE